MSLRWEAVGTFDYSVTLGSLLLRLRPWILNQDFDLSQNLKAGQGGDLEPTWQYLLNTCSITFFCSSSADQSSKLHMAMFGKIFLPIWEGAYVRFSIQFWNENFCRVQRTRKISSSNQNAYDWLVSMWILKLSKTFRTGLQFALIDVECVKRSTARK